MTTSFSFSYPAIAGICFSLLVTYIPVACYLNYQKCSNIKGPFLASISDLWLFRATLGYRVYLDLPAALEAYETNLVRIAPNKVATNDPQIWRHTSSVRSRFTRGTWYDSMSLDPKVGNVLSTRDDEAHNALRLKMIRSYSGKDLPNMERNIDNRIGDLVTLIRRVSGQGKPIDFAQLAQFFTLDTLTEMAFEKPFGFLTKNEDVFNYIKEVTAFLVVLELSCNVPFVRSILSSRLLAGLNPKPTDKTGLGAMLGVAQGVVQRRYASDAKDYEDMLGSFKKHGLTKEQAESECMLQILAGSDSTATAIRMTFLYILTNPAVYMKLRAEIDNSANKITKPVITSSEARALPYLQSCIKESLRVWPPLAGLIGKVSPPGGETLGGTFVPEGVEICWAPVSMQHRKDIYGADADVYRPERWLEAAAKDDDGATLAKMERTLELVFGSGKYGCLGKTVAQIELDKVFVTLLQNFDWGVVDPVTPLRTKCSAMHMQSDFWLRATERTH